MTHKLIKTDNYLLVVDDSVHPYDSSKVGNPLAHLPINGSPILEGVDLLPPYSRHQEDGVEDAVIRFKESYSKFGVTDFELSAFSVGYLQAREKYKYTEKDMRKAIDMARLQGPESFLVKYREEEIIQSFHQYPTEFISDDEISHEGIGTYSTDLMDIGVSNLKPIKVPKTITTAQGVQWVGKYK